MLAPTRSSCMPESRLRSTASATRPSWSRMSSTRRASSRLYSTSAAGSSRYLGDLLAAPDQIARDHAEAIVVEPQRVAHEREPVEHHASRNDRARLARE